MHCPSCNSPLSASAPHAWRVGDVTMRGVPLSAAERDEALRAEITAGVVSGVVSGVLIAVIAPLVKRALFGRDGR